MPASSSEIFPVSPRSSCESCPSGKKYLRRCTWNQDQEYEGEFLREGLHGEGKYKWKDFGVYEGGFYSNYKEGYALMSFPDNSCFEGLFVRNQPFGPGIFTHSNGRQDVGFWVGRKLVRLSRSVDYIVPRLAPTSAAKVKLLQFRRLIPIDEEASDSLNEIFNNCGCPANYLSCPYSSLIFDPRSYFFDKITFDKTYFLNMKPISEEFMSDSDNWGVLMCREDFEEEQEKEEETSEDIFIPSHCLCAGDEFVMNYEDQSLIDICEKKDSLGDAEMGILAYFTHYGMTEGFESKDQFGGLENTGEMEGEEEEIKRPKLLAWNRNELCIRMLQQIFRYRGFEGKLTFNIAKLMLGARTAFRKTGEKERQCLEFLKTCAVGPPEAVKAMLCNYDMSEDLTDARGNNSVMFAAATDQHEIIDILLDYGADVNSFNDESLTPLNLCLLRRLSHAYDIGNWETAFLPEEIETRDDDYEINEWRQQISITSLDRIFGDGMSIYEMEQPNSSSITPDKESSGTKSRSYINSEMSALSRTQFLSKSLLYTRTCSLLGASLSRTGRGVKAIGKTKSKIRHKLQKTKEYEKSMRPPSKNSYFFDLGPQKKPEVEIKDKVSSRRFVGMNKEDLEEIPGEGNIFLSEIRKRTLEIDKTIEKLLKRGADPNISEVPKPSIHLGVYTKNWKIVHLLLSYGANPDCQLYSNEGLLTPLHVLVLLKPSLEYIQICDLLLNFGANPEQRTHPEFAFNEEEKPFLDPKEGRTPLQLLCMRPDLEYADPEDYLIKIALMLIGVCDKTRFYNGYSYLALAMYFRNIKLLKALLDTKNFDPNQLLGNDMGTVLYLLVSTEFQKKTPFDTSIQICDSLLDAGANPLKQISYPEKLAGNCIDYGYREVEAAKATRRVSAGNKKENGKRESDKRGSKKAEQPEQPQKSVETDHLKDHINVLEYLSKRVEEMKKKKRGKNAEKKPGRINRPERLTKPDKGNGNENTTNVKQKPLSADKIAGVENKENGKSKGGNDLKKEGNKLGIGEDEGNNDNDEDDKAKQKTKERKEVGKRKNSKNGVENKVEGKNETSKKQNGGTGGRKLSLKKDTQKTESDLLKNSLKKSTGGKKPCPSEIFPEKLRQSMLKLIGTCANMDVNELLLPYVVLRDGDLYYGLKGRNKRALEQYSLI